jgi:hypothetical protein
MIKSNGDMDSYEFLNHIAKENKRKGTVDWWYNQTPKDPIIQGFSNKISYFPTEIIEFKITTFEKLTSYKILIFRLGYYGGLGGRLIDNITINYTNSIIQENCMFEFYSKMTDCSNWLVTSRWKVPLDSVTGVFVALPIASLQLNISENYDHHGNYIPFVVKQQMHARKSDILFKISDLTWVAYNKFGTWNIYRGNGSIAFSSRATKASYNRPFLNRLVPYKGQYQNFLFGSEYAMIHWLEKYDYNVAYVSCSDFEELGLNNQLKGFYKTVLSVGHDEYWSQGFIYLFIYFFISNKNKK